MMNKVFLDIQFSCVPLNDLDSLPTWPGVYTVLCVQDGREHFLDVGQSGNIQERIRNHDREGCWNENCQGGIWVCVKQVGSRTMRDTLERGIRDRYNPPYGDR